MGFHTIGNETEICIAFSEGEGKTFIALYVWNVCLVSLRLRASMISILAGPRLSSWGLRHFPLDIFISSQYPHLEFPR